MAVLLERSESVSALDGIFRDIQAGLDGRLILVGGEAGVGKTALLRLFCGAQDGSVRILWGACEPLLAPRPLGPLLDAAEATGGEFEELVVEGARPHQVTAALLRELRRRGPTVLVLEDMHWADEATLDVLALLAARIGSVPALVLASYRDDELERAEQLRIVLGELVRGSARLSVEPLSRQAVLELAQPHGVDGDELFRKTGGNPFFVTEVLAAGGRQVPDTVRDAVMARAARLSRPARTLLEAVAVIPGQVDLWLLERLAGDLAERLEECLASGILSAGVADVAFRHELGRLAILDGMSPARRIALHRAALAALVDHGGEDLDFARLAHHAEAAADVESVLLYAPQAAERAASAGSHREAASQYARALSVSDGLSPQMRADLLRRRADECYMTDQFSEAIDAQEEALEIHRRLGDPRMEGDSLRLLSRLLRFVGRTHDAYETGLEAVELLEPLPAGHELAIAYANISHLCVCTEDAEGALGWGNRAVDLATRLDDSEVHVYALALIGAIQFLTGHAEGLPKLEQALQLSQQLGLEEHAGRTFVNLVVWPLRHRMFTHVARCIESGLEYCGERGLDTWRLYLYACRARLELDRGRWSEAVATAGVVLRDPRSAPVPRGWALAVIAVVKARRGDADASRQLVDAHVVAQSTGELQCIAPFAVARAEAAWLTGEHESVAEATDAALALALRHRASWIVGELTYWRWQAGIRDELAAGAAAEPFALSMAGDWAAAAERWRTLGCPYEAALALAGSDDAVTVRRSIDELLQLGARPAAAIVSQRLRREGVRSVPRGPQPRTRANPAGLTPRELEVLALLADGLRNGQIAQRLVISVKTVNHHVSAVLRKLDVRTRHEAGDEAVRLGLAPAGTAPPSKPV